MRYILKFLAKSLLGATSIMISDAAFAACGNVIVDCATHRIVIGGKSLSARESVIDCGRPGLTKNGMGKIGGRHSGRRVKDGVAIDNFPGMGQSGGGKVFHTVFWRNPPWPKGQDASRGCIRISPPVLAILKTCKGSNLQIKNAKGGGQNSTTNLQATPGFSFQNAGQPQFQYRPPGNSPRNPVYTFPFFKPPAKSVPKNTERPKYIPHPFNDVDAGR